MRVLTDEQEQAVARREGSLLLAAGAGSGKTSVLVERFVRAIREDGIAPGRILAITFTERAAGELRERVRSRLLELGERDAARAAEAAFVSTFHGFCARLLRIHPLQAAVEPDFQILEESFADRLRTLAFSDALASFVGGERPQAVDLVAAHGADQLRAMALGAYAQLRSQGQSEPRLPSPRPGTRSGEEPPGEQADKPSVTAELDGRAAQACALIGELVERFGGAYARRKHARRALDFDDLELCARGLLEQRADVREAWAERFQLLMVDEFQDTNPRQLQILAALDRDNLFTVGDGLQSIYSFRHADVNLFRERHAHLAKRGASLALTRNFRSRPAILAAVERIFAERMGERFAPLTAARPRETVAEPLVELLLTDKRGWQGVPTGDDLEGMPDATPWRQAEARLLAGRVAELVASGAARPGEIVVLLRALGDLPVYESALRRHGLLTLAGVGGFWGHQQVGDLLAWLRALANPLDELALYSTLASPLVGVSSDGLALIARATHERRGGVWSTIEQAFSVEDPERERHPGDEDRQGGGEASGEGQADAPVRRDLDPG
ncbi:MAG TPA: UvrD-helicase domain-containing protein, partial [Solirubrobacteraceae bacterium]|nr:UvrD-helicase domain-containing protein [Solirubrobacteraceae bacterium]